MTLSANDLQEIYKEMVLIRALDQKLNSWYQDGIIKEANHPSTGQEAITAGSCFGLRKSDQVMPSLRTRGAFIGKGVPIKTILRAMCAKKDSPTKGHETSHHTAYPEHGVLMGTGMVGSSISIGVGAALALKLKQRDDVVLTYFGDGASNRGDFHEAINLAAVWRLPVIFIIENNQIALSTTLEESTLCENFSDRAKGYGIPGHTIDGNNVFEVYDYTQNAIVRARKGEGPTLLDCVTTRLLPHVGFFPETRPPEIMDELWKRDPIKKLEEYFFSNNVLTVEDTEKINSDTAKMLDDELESIQDEPGCEPEHMLCDVCEYEEV